MNEPASMCRFPCSDPKSEALKLGMPPKPPPVRKPPRKLPGFNISTVENQRSPQNRDLGWDLNAAKFRTNLEDAQRYILSRESSGEDFVSPPYRIHNGGPSGDLSDLTVRTDLVHANGVLEYDLHNLYGTSK